MFLMWAQQWRYIAVAMSMGYRVMRADTDVYFAEDPYPILHGPLFSRFEMVVQHDFFGAKERPRCDGECMWLELNSREPVCCDVLPGQPADLSLRSSFVLAGPARQSKNGGLMTCGSRPPHLALLNIGLVYLRSLPGGGVFAVINGTWERFIQRVGEPPRRPPHLGGAVDTQALIDQPFMREVANSLAVPDDNVVPRKPAEMWSLIPGEAAEIYETPLACALRDDNLCSTVRTERRRTAFLVQLVRPRRSTPPRCAVPLLVQVEDAVGLGGAHVRCDVDGNRRQFPMAFTQRLPIAFLAFIPRRDERIALAPDWFFGRGCLSHMRAPLEFLKLARPDHGDAATCRAQPTLLGQAQLAPGPAAGLLVATHFVYSMALKRKRAFRAFGWDLADTRNRSIDSGHCFQRGERAMLFGHTFFDQLQQTKSILCSLPPRDDPACSCCAGVGSAQAIIANPTTTRVAAIACQ